MFYTVGFLLFLEYCEESLHARNKFNGILSYSYKFQAKSFSFLKYRYRGGVHGFTSFVGKPEKVWLLTNVPMLWRLNNLDTICTIQIIKITNWRFALLSKNAKLQTPKDSLCGGKYDQSHVQRRLPDFISTQTPNTKYGNSLSTDMFILLAS